MQKIITRKPLLAALFVIGSFLLFGFTLNFPFFIFDDGSHIGLNTLVTEKLSLSALFEMWNRSKIPLTFNFWQLIASVFGKDSAAPFRFFNILFHGLNSFLVYLFIKKMAQICFFEKENENKTHLELISLLGALSFLTHPIHTEVTVWVSCLKDALATFWALLSIIFYLKSRTQKEKFFYYSFLTFIFFGFGVLSKPSVLPFLLIYIWLDLFLFNIPFKKIFTLFFHYLIFSFFISFFYLTILQHHTTAISFLYKVLIAIDALRLTLFNVFLPFDLKFDYQRTFTTVGTQFSSSFPYQMAMLATTAFLYGTFVSAYKKILKPLHLSMGIFIILISINMGFIPFLFQNISTVSDRYAYLPSIGFSLLFSWFAKLALERTNRTKLILGIFCCLLLTFSVLSILQARKWKSSSELIRYSLKTETFSYPSLLGLGYALENEGHSKQATLYYQEAIKVLPENPEAYFHLLHASVDSMENDTAQGRLAEKTIQLITEKKFVFPLDSELDLIDYFINRQEYLFARARLDRIQAQINMETSSRLHIRASLIKNRIKSLYDKSVYDSLWFLGNLELQKKNEAEAQRLFNEALELQPDGEYTPKIKSLLEKINLQKNQNKN